MNKKWVRKDEYGGFLPLELNEGEEYFVAYEKYLSRFNSVKASFDYLLKNIQVNKIYIPYYYCPSTTEAIKKMGVEVIYYHINSSFLPMEIPDESDAAVLLVDYFGVCNSKIIEIIQQMKHSEIVVDRAHSFFAEPILQAKVHNVYSARKFFGVPDGSYIISKSINPFMDKLSEAFSYSKYLVETYEMGTNYAYKDKKIADEMIAENYSSMSKLSHGILKNVNYECVIERRRINYSKLYSILSKYNELDIDDNLIVYQFPLLINKWGREIKRQLIGERIYVSTLWASDKIEKNANFFEKKMRDHCIFLTVDQRYNEEDMEYIAKMVIRYMGEK